MSRFFMVAGGVVVAGGVLLLVSVASLFAVVWSGVPSAACSPTGVTPGSGTGVVRVVQANIKYDLPAAAFSADLGRVVESAPDLVSLNEAGTRSDAAATPAGYTLFRAPGGSAQQRSTAVLWRTDRWELVDGGRILLVRSGPQRTDAGRSASWATVRGVGENAAAGTVSIVSAHLMVNPARIGPNKPLRQQLYRQGMVTLGGLVSDLSAAGAVFVAGDFNSQWAADDPWGPRAMLGALPAGARLVSTMDVLSQVGTHDGGGSIDYVFFQPSAAAATGQVVVDLAGSDHKAVLADFDLTGSPAGTQTTAPADTTGDHAPAAAASVSGVALPEVAGYSAEQVANAAAIVAAGVELGVSGHGQRVAVMTALGESSLRVLDYGDEAGPDSRGLFQQRASGWGSLADRMDPRRSALSFYRALVRVPGWESMPPTLAAHETQRNADPYYYEPFWEPGGAITAALAAAGVGTPAVTAGGGACPVAYTGGAGGAVVWPLEPAVAPGADRHNWGGSGGRWSSWHTGTDFSVACGTPVYAAHAGVVSIDSSQRWAGPQLVKVSQGPGALTTWYAHMQTALVPDGTQVAAGTPLGLVGNLGNTSGDTNGDYSPDSPTAGCHLHFEVHLKNGSIYGGDNINPSSWLAANVTLPNGAGAAAVGGALR